MTRAIYAAERGGGIGGLGREMLTKSLEIKDYKRATRQNRTGDLLIMKRLPTCQHRSLSDCKSTPIRETRQRKSVVQGVLRATHLTFMVPDRMQPNATSAGIQGNAPVPLGREGVG
jgi:hypothetical protein